MRMMIMYAVHNNMNISLSKLKAIVIYFATHTDGRFLGKVKLMKLFYFLDFIHLKKYGAPVTYDTYINLEHGPIPSTIKNLVDTAYDDPDNSLLADVIKFESPADGRLIHRVTALRNFQERDKRLFTESELSTLETVCRRFGDKNTKFVEETSHKEAPWRLTSTLDSISYKLAVKDEDCKVSEEDIDLMLSISSR